MKSGATVRHLKIGQAARAAGLTPKTIRYYEEIGLLDPPPRTASGYRLYDGRQVELMKFIKKSRDLGFSLAEIRSILQLGAHATRPCGHVVQLLSRRIERLDRMIDDMTSVRDNLAGMRDTAEAAAASDSDGAVVCPIIEHAAPAGNDRPGAAWMDARSLARYA